jgi:hypothetical protein
MYGGGVCVRSLVPWWRLVHLDEGRAAAVRLPGGPAAPRTAPSSVHLSSVGHVSPLTSRDLTRGA